MEEVRGVNTWREELASLVEDTGIRYAGEPMMATWTRKAVVHEPEFERESLKDQVTGFLKSWAEMLLELGKGCKEILQQTVITEDSFVVRKLGGPVAKVSCQLKFLNEFLPEDRDPVHAWPVIFFVFILALSALSLTADCHNFVPPVKKVQIHPPSATRILLPDGRHLAYHEKGVPANRARFSLIAPHSFLSSRLAGIPGVKTSLLEEFGVHLVTYDLPGFGESDPHPNRNLNSSASDMLDLANAVGIVDRFWVLGYSGGSMHAWAALKYIPLEIRELFAAKKIGDDQAKSLEILVTNSSGMDGSPRQIARLSLTTKEKPSAESIDGGVPGQEGREGRQDNLRQLEFSIFTGEDRQDGYSE